MITIEQVKEHFKNFEATEIVDENGNYAKIKHLAKRLIEDTNGDYYMIIKKHYFLVYDAKSGIFAKPVEEEYWKGAVKNATYSLRVLKEVKSKRDWLVSNGFANLLRVPIVFSEKEHVRFKEGKVKIGDKPKEKTNLEKVKEHYKGVISVIDRTYEDNLVTIIDDSAIYEEEEDGDICSKAVFGQGNDMKLYYKNSNHLVEIYKKRTLNASSTITISTKEPIITQTLPISTKVRKWATERGIYEKSTPFKQLEKTYEELMELMEGLTAWKQGLEFFKNSKGEIVNTLDAIKDAYGDVAVTLENGTAFFDYTLEEAEQTAFKEIENRTGKMINGSFVKN